jgi:hypothetical protein
MQRIILIIALICSISILAPTATLAHQPFFEDQDITFDQPWPIKDATISTAVYATLSSTTDVDYFTFEGAEQEVILLELTIPQITGQDSFAPTLVLMGPDLPEIDMPQGIVQPEGSGALLLEPSAGPAPTFYEPFSGTSYWERQEERVTLPAGGQYVVAVWHPQGEVGRYTFVIGEKERLGGDPAFPVKMRSYWTPVEVPAPGPESADVAPKYSCGH